jgi:hypothetical protein
VFEAAAAERAIRHRIPLILTRRLAAFLVLGRRHSRLVAAEGGFYLALDHRVHDVALLLLMAGLDQAAEALPWLQI